MPRGNENKLLSFQQEKAGAMSEGLLPLPKEPQKPIKKRQSGFRERRRTVTQCISLFR